jgi:hypothetical protein
VADAVYFNSDYHRDIFLATLPNMLKHFGDYNELETVGAIAQKATVLQLGLDLAELDSQRGVASDGEVPLIVWNHRWEEVTANIHLSDINASLRRMERYWSDQIRYIY